LYPVGIGDVVRICESRLGSGKPRFTAVSGFLIGVSKDSGRSGVTDDAAEFSLLLNVEVVGLLAVDP